MNVMDAMALARRRSAWIGELVMPALREAREKMMNTPHARLHLPDGIDPGTFLGITGHIHKTIEEHTQNLARGQIWSEIEAAHALAQGWMLYAEGSGDLKLRPAPVEKDAPTISAFKLQNEEDVVTFLRPLAVGTNPFYRKTARLTGLLPASEGEDADPAAKETADKAEAIQEEVRSIVSLISSQVMTSAMVARQSQDNPALLDSIFNAGAEAIQRVVEVVEIAQAGLIPIENQENAVFRPR